MINYLVTSHKLNLDNEVNPELNWFEWLAKLDFVEFTQNTHRLDDVARDVFRLSLWQEDKDQFQQVNDLLTKYYEDKAINEVPPDSSYSKIYENLEWREYTAQSLYHALFARQQDWDINFLSHLFIACYFQETEVVSSPFKAIVAEVNLEDNDLLSSAVKKFLQSIEPIFDVVYLAFEEQKLVNYINYFKNKYSADYFFEELSEYFEELSSEELLDKAIEEYGDKEELDELFSGNRINEYSEELNLKRKYVFSLFQKLVFEQLQITLKSARKYCFNRIKSLDGFAKFVALVYKSKCCSPNRQLRYLQQAKSQAEKIISDSDPEFSSGLFVWDLGNALLNLGRYEEAIASYDKALEIKPDQDEAWNNRGVALGNLGRYEEEIASYDKALEIKPENDAAWVIRGLALANLGRYEEVVVSCDQALEIKPENDAAWVIRGLALANLGRYEEVVVSCDQALEIKPDFDQTWYYRGMALYDLGRYEEAIASYDKALEIKPDYVEAWYYRGNSLGNLGRYEEVIASYDKAIEIKPDNEEAWNNRGVALANLGRHEEAIASYDKAIEIKPDDDSTWGQRGLTLMNLERYEEAFKSYDKALELNPDNANAWYNRACCFALQNQIESAIENLAKAISLNNECQEMAKTDTDFDNIREDARFKALVFFTSY